MFMALHATQGPNMGLPQMIQSRAQFGYRGVSIPLLAVLVDFLGYNVVCAITIASGLHTLFGIGIGPVVALSALLTAVLSIYGHDWVHRVARWLFYISLPAFGLLTLGIAVGVIGANKAAAAAYGFNWVAFFTVAAAAASNAIAYAPFVSDYSRYLRRDTPAAPIIGAVFAGSTISCLWMISIGAWLACYIATPDPVTAINIAGAQINVGVGMLVASVAVCMNLAGMTMNTYSSGLAVLTLRDSLRPAKPTAKRPRVLAIILVTVLWSLIALAGGDNVVAAAWLMLTLLLYVLVPWTAVNLVDFFFVRRGHYAITQFFVPHGIYGDWAWRGLLSYATGLLSMTPFAVLPGLYTGPWARAMGGVDIAWLVGLVVSAAVYKLVAPDVSNEGAAIAQSERELEGCA